MSSFGAQGQYNTNDEAWTNHAIAHLGVVSNKKTPGRGQASKIETETKRGELFVFLERHRFLCNCHKESVFLFLASQG